MAWFDGTFEQNLDELRNEYPVVITEDIRFNSDFTKMALINHFTEGTVLYDLSDPHLENGVYKNEGFYHTFLGDDAIKAEKAIREYVSKGFGKNEYEVTLLRFGDKNLIKYGYGELCLEKKIEKAVTEKINNDITEDNFFVLPLKIFAFKCPVCKERTLQYRGMFEICPICYWEDEGMNDDDEEPAFGPNGRYTIREYREEFFNKKKSESEK